MHPAVSGNRKQLMQQPWGLWWIQALRLTRIEVKRNLFSWKASWIYFLAFVPTLILLIHALLSRQLTLSMSEDTQILAGIIQFYYVRLGIFFGCLGIFSRLIRGEMIERSLHFYFLSPVRREIILLAKFAAGSISALVLFGSAILADFVLTYVTYGPSGRDYIFNGPGLGQLGAYLTITGLASLGYGAVFLLLSLIFKNPTPAAMIVMAWEAINPIAPSILQKISVASYLHHLMPINVPAQGIFALLTVQTEGDSAWTATLGLLTLVVVVLVYSCYRIRTLEIRYTTE